MPRFLSDKRSPIPKVKKINYKLKRQMKKESNECVNYPSDSIVVPYYTYDDERGVAAFSCGRNYAGTEIDIPSMILKGGKTYRVEIEFLAFRDCCNLKEINIPESCERLLRLTFWDCYNLERVIIPSSVRMLFPSLFVGCENLKEIIFQNPENIKMKGEVFGGLDYEKVKVIDQSKNIEYTLSEFIRTYNQK